MELKKNVMRIVIALTISFGIGFSLGVTCLYALTSEYAHLAKQCVAEKRTLLVKSAECVVGLESTTSFIRSMLEGEKYAMAKTSRSNRGARK
jgi:hypothetical protein